MRALNSGDAALQFRAYFVVEGAALAAQDGGSRFSAPTLRQILVLRDQASRWALGTALRAVLDGGAGGARERKAARSVLESLSGAARPADRREIETVKSLFKRLRRESAEDSDLAAAYATLPRFLDGPAFVPQPGSGRPPASSSPRRAVSRTCRASRRADRTGPRTERFFPEAGKPAAGA